MVAAAQEPKHWVIFRCRNFTCIGERWPVGQHERIAGKIAEAERCPRCGRFGEPRR